MTRKKIILIMCLLLALFSGVIFVRSQNVFKRQEVQNTSLKNAEAVLDINGKKYQTEIKDRISVYDFMDKLKSEGKINFTEKNYVGIGEFIETIDGVKGNGEKNWIYYVNDKKAEIGVSDYKINGEDVVSWKYEKYESR